MGESRALEGRSVSSKGSSGSKTETRELMGGTKVKNVSTKRLIALHANQLFLFSKKEIEK